MLILGATFLRGNPEKVLYIASDSGATARSISTRSEHPRDNETLTNVVRASYLKLLSSTRGNSLDGANKTIGFVLHTSQRRASRVKKKKKKETRNLVKKNHPPLINLLYIFQCSLPFFLLFVFQQRHISTKLN